MKGERNEAENGKMVKVKSWIFYSLVPHWKEKGKNAEGGRRKVEKSRYQYVEFFIPEFRSGRRKGGRFKAEIF